MKIQTEDLWFDNLFKQALSEWPRFVNLELETQELAEVNPTDKGYSLLRYKSLPWDRNLDKYAVKNLYELCEKISEKYYGHPQELLMINLHDKIFNTIWKLAKYVTYLDLEHLRSEIVQQEFEGILNDGMKNKREDWRQEEHQLINHYFNVNYPKKGVS